MQLAFIIQNQSAAVGGDHHFQRTDYGDLAVGRHAIRGAQNPFWDFQSKLVRTIGRKANGAASDDGMHHIGTLRKRGGAGREQINLAAADFQAYGAACSVAIVSPGYTVVPIATFASPR